MTFYFSASINSFSPISFPSLCVLDLLNSIYVFLDLESEQATLIVIRLVFETFSHLSFSSFSGKARLGDDNLNDLRI